jgi:pyruvate formate lyase activating enzyme
MKGIVICGSEPTYQEDLPEVIRELKEIGLKVKLDTNGSNPDALEKVLEHIDYVAMDIKGPRGLYPLLTGLEKNCSFNIKKSMNLIHKSGIDYEFRTTVVPIINGGFSWLTKNDISETARWIYNETQDDEHKYFLQKFRAGSKEEMIDERFSKEKLPEEFHETPERYLVKCLDWAREHLPNTKIRGLEHV